MSTLESSILKTKDKTFNHNDPDEVAENVYKSAAGLSNFHGSYLTGDADTVVKAFMESNAKKK